MNIVRHRACVAALIAAALLPAAAQTLEERYRPARNWLSYDRDNTGRRYSELKQIHKGNVARLVPKWVFQYSPPQLRSEATPLIRDGVMYLTAGGMRAFAIDARSGRAFWRFDYPYSRDRGTANPNWSRGFGLSGNRLFVGTPDCHLIALDSRNGAMLWRSPVTADQPCFGSTGAPIIAKDRVLMGIRGGDTGRVRGYLDAFNVETGEREWRFYTVPEPGQPGSETWPGTGAWKAGGGTPWTSGTYDPDLDLLFWPTGNPGPKDFDGRDREGDNLYTASMLALRPDDGELKWHFQFTPHDEHDWDSNQTPVLVDAEWQGRPRKLLLQANRNGFYYVLDRETGEFLHGSPFVEQNWSDGFTPEGRPLARPEAAPSPGGTRACPDIHGGTNWQSPAFHPGAELLFVMAREACGVYYRTGHSVDHDEESGALNVLRAIDLHTGQRRWEIPVLGVENREVAFAGAMTTGGGLVFFSSRDGNFMAADAESGELLWHFNTGGTIRASPVTYQVDDQQYVAITTKSGVFAFGLFE